jgi:hypothetical protein
VGQEQDKRSHSKREKWERHADQDSHESLKPSKADSIRFQGLARCSVLQLCPQPPQRQPMWWTQQVTHCSEAHCSFTPPCCAHVVPSRQQTVLLSPSLGAPLQSLSLSQILSSLSETFFGPLRGPIGEKHLWCLCCPQGSLRRNC